MVRVRNDAPSERGDPGLRRKRLQCGRRRSLRIAGPRSCSHVILGGLAWYLALRTDAINARLVGRAEKVQTAEAGWQEE